MLMEHAERADEAMDVIAAGGGPAGLMTAALLDAAGVRAEACERGSEPTRQSRGTARHPRTLEVLTMPGAGDGRRISDVLLAQGRRVLNTHCAGLPDLLDYRGLDAPLPFTLTLPQWGTEHAPARYLGARGVRVRARPPAPACPAACPRGPRRRGRPPRRERARAARARPSSRS